MKTSLKHIAEECGVSMMAVSKALRNHPSISELRRQEIKTVAQRMGYKPNMSARSLRGGKSHSIGILWSLGGPHNSIGLIRDISLKLMNNDYVSYIADSLSDPDVVNSTLKDYVARNIDGLIIQVSSQAEYNNFSNNGIKQYLRQIGNVVIVNDTDNELPAWGLFDEIQRRRQPAIEEIIRYLASKGRKKIAMLFRPLAPWREEAIIEAMKANRLDNENCRLINNSKNKLVISDQQLKQIYSDGVLNYDAVLTQNDESAAQVIKYLIEHGIKVPQDVAVTGFNDSLLGQYYMPPIASVKRRSNELADTAVDLLIKCIKNKKTAVQKINLPMQFIKRESAG